MQGGTQLRRQIAACFHLQAPWEFWLGTQTDSESQRWALVHRRGLMQGTGFPGQWKETLFAAAAWLAPRRATGLSEWTTWLPLERLDP